MNVNEQKLYTFNFNLGTDFPPVTQLGVSIEAPTKEEAVERCKALFSKVLSDLAMEFPTKPKK